MLLLNIEKLNIFLENNFYKISHFLENIKIKINKATKKSSSLFFYIYKDQIWILSPTDGRTEAQKAQNNEFVENGLKNWALMNLTNTKIGLNDKKM